MNNPEAKAQMDGLLAKLPALPRMYENGVYDGHDWIDALKCWHAVGVWGTRGWNLGSWPLVIIAHHDDEDRRVFGVVTYCEGDLSISAYDTEAGRDAETDQIALFQWRQFENGPKPIPDEDAPAEETARYLRAFGGPYRGLR